MKLVSPRVGEVEYSESDVITLITPFLGFPELQDFLLINDDASYPFLWLQSTEDPDICFLIVEPEQFHPDYAPEIPAREYKILAIADKYKEDIKTFCMVTIPTNIESATVNLRAPVLVNFDKHIAKQIVLEDDKYQIRTPLLSKPEEGNKGEKEC